MSKAAGPGAARTIALYPWFKFCKGLMFWQAVWFLYLQSTLSAAEAVVLYAIYDIATTALEVPSGVMSDRLGRRLTLVASGVAGLVGVVLLAVGGSFEVFVLAQVLLGASAAFASGTDSAMLYESLAADGRTDEVEAQEIRAWRFSFVALALSAVSGGLMALQMFALPFLATAIALGTATVIALRFTEPPRSRQPLAEGAELVRLGSLKGAFRNPVLVWLFALGALMYGFSHVPFVFGQPFILEALTGAGYEAEAPAISGLVTSTMMLLSVATSLFALRLRQSLGLPALLLLAFAMQIGLIGVLALTNSAIAIAFLFLRMVPDALSRPFVLARIQPLLSDDSRATFLSLQSFVGRLMFAGTLLLSALMTSAEGQMPYSDIRLVLGCYALGGLVCLGVLAVAARRVPVGAARRD
jgi:MFS family permease